MNASRYSSNGAAPFTKNDNDKKFDVVDCILSLKAVVSWYQVMLVIVSFRFVFKAATKNECREIIITGDLLVPSAAKEMAGNKKEQRPWRRTKPITPFKHKMIISL